MQFNRAAHVHDHWAWVGVYFQIFSADLLHYIFIPCLPPFSLQFHDRLTPTLFIPFHHLYIPAKMSLAAHIDPDELITNLKHHPHQHHGAHVNSATTHQTPYSTRYNAQTELSKFRIPHDGAPADAVHQMLKDELDLDGRPNLNLASFVGTYMENEAEQLMIENLSKNLSDADEYPAMYVYTFYSRDDRMKISTNRFGCQGCRCTLAVSPSSLIFGKPSRELFSGGNANPCKGCSKGRESRWFGHHRLV